MKNFPVVLMLFLPFCMNAQAVDSASVAIQVDSLIKVSRTLTEKRNFEQALALIDVAEKLVLEISGKETALYGNVCFGRGRVFSIKEAFPEAEKWHLEAYRIRKKILGEEHPQYASCLLSLALVYFRMGNFKKSEPYLVEVLSIYEKINGKENPNYYQSLRLLGIVNKNLSNYEKGEQMLLEVKKILEGSVGKDHPDYAICLNSLANLYKNMGLYEAAEQVYNESNEAIKKVMGARHTQYLRGQLGLAMLYTELGNFEKAEQLVLEVKSVCVKSASGEEHPFTIMLLMLLGSICKEKLEVEKAEKYYLEAKEILEKKHLKESNDYGEVLQLLAELTLGSADYSKSENLYLESLAIYEKTLGAESFESTMIHYRLAEVYYALGNFEKSESLYLKAKAVFDKAFKKGHPGYVIILDGLTFFYERQKRFSISEPLLAEMFALELARLSKGATFLSERELAIYTLTFQHRLDNLGTHILNRLSDHEKTGILPALAFDNALFHKGFLLNAANRVNNLSVISPVSAEISNNLKIYRRRLAAELTKPLVERDSANVAELEENANILEKDLARTIAGYDEAIRQVTWQEVQTALKSGEAAIEFVHYLHNIPDKTDSIMYAALLLRPGDTQPQFIPLFEEKELTLLLRGASGGSNFLKINALYAKKSGDDKQKNLYDLVWKALEKHLVGVKAVYCSPAGLLHRINLAAIPANDGTALGDKYSLVVLGSTRHLLAPNTGTQTTIGDAYLAGGIRYDTDSTAIAQAINTSSLRSIELPETLVFQSNNTTAARAGIIDYLPATATEVNDIGQILGRASIHVRVDTGFYATEEAFRQLGIKTPSPRIIHLATHGYFFPDLENKAETKVGSLGREPVFKTSDQPMIRSGMIMAGAKQTWLTGKHPLGFEDGILTAYEISQMNLSGTELVVLSACETGLGDIMGNEGVYGLQRAFKIAGAKYLVMSLWKVDDCNTREFMIAFYQHWLSDKQAIPQAFRMAQSAMRKKHPSAYSWAGFVLIE